MREDPEREGPDQRHPSRTRVYTGVGTSMILRLFFYVLFRSHRYFESRPHYIHSPAGFKLTV